MYGGFLRLVLLEPQAIQEPDRKDQQVAKDVCCSQAGKFHRIATVYGGVGQKFLAPIETIHPNSPTSIAPN